MKPRTFAFVNLSGCLALTVLLVVQWLGNNTLQSSLKDRYSELDKVKDERDAALVRVSAMGEDVSHLKESLESVNKEVLTLQDQIQAKEGEAEHARNLQTDLDTAHKSLDEWHEAVTQRDERIAEMDKLLTQYKAKLEEAAARLNKVAAERKAAAAHANP